jgi:O-antigen/teichoic acid export membrane protein
MSPKKWLSSFQWDLGANLAGSGWSALLQFACIPLYIKFLGVEGYGLVGFYLMFQAMVQILDFGITPTMNREMARYYVQPEKAGEARDFVRTLELGYWLIGALIGLIAVASAPFIATYWIRTNSLSARDLREAVMLMGFLALFQWPFSFYEAGLIGLHRQVLLNVIKICVVTVGNGGTLLALWLISPTVKTFFLWQALIAALQTALTAFFLWRNLPHSDRSARADLKLLRNVSGFAAGVSVITICAMILTQIDKLILSRLLSLEMFGYYVIAGTFGRALLMFTTPVFNTIFPRFSALVAVHDEAALRQLYNRCTQLMAVLVVPVAAVLALFPFEILLLWTRNLAVASNAAPIARVLAIATALNGLMILPYTLQLAYGWTSIGLRMNLFLLLTLVPATWILATRYGAMGGAFAYLAFMCIYMVVAVPLTHRRLLRGGAGQWCAGLGMSSAAVLVVAGLGRAFITNLTPALTALSLLVVLIAATVAGAFAAPQVRIRLVAGLSRIRLGYV